MTNNAVSARASHSVIDRSDRQADIPLIQLVGHTENVTSPEIIGAIHPTPTPNDDSVREAPSSPPNLEPPTDDFFVTLNVLDTLTLARLVEQRNSSLQAMYANWQAAAARYPQEIALDDPMLDLMMAPASFSGSSNVPSSWTLQGSQKFPWKGKREARGNMASQNAQAAALDVEDTRLQLTLASRVAFADYLLAQRTRELNNTEIKLLTELKAVALTRYETNQTPQQDVLQAEVDLSEARRRGVEAARAHRVAVARINTLLQRPPRAPLPPPSEIDPTVESLPDDDDLAAISLKQRPDLSARSARIAAEQAAYCLALREFYPDIEVYGRYDRFWIDREQQGSVGIKLNLPVQRDRRRAAVEEALAKIARMRAEYEADVAKIQFEVQAALAQVQESRQTTELYSTEILKAAEQNVASARAGYEAGSVSFLTLVSAQRQLIDARQRMNEAQAEYQRQLAELERAIGAPLVDATPFAHE
jgi:outer membrane protein TolC